MNKIFSFKVDLPCALWTDWSKEGIGFSLFQKHCDCALNHMCCKDGWKLVLAKSRFTRGAELGYKPIEGEALAVIYALQKCKIFILGCPKLLLITDHKPLVSIFGSKSMEKIENPRLFSLKEKSLPYQFDIVHVSGARNMAADAFSRFPSQEMDNNKEDTSSFCSMKAIFPYLRKYANESVEIEEEIDEKIEASLIASISTPEDGHVHAVSLDRIKSESTADKSMSDLIAMIINGFPETKEELPEHLKPYWNVRDDLLVLDNYVLFKNRAVVPPRLRRETLETLHAAHQGVTGMRARAAKSIFWPGINHDIDVVRGQCRDCTGIAPSQCNEPLIISSPKYPFQMTVADYFSLKGFKYLLYADRYSAWISIVKIRIGEANFKFLRKFLVHLFATFGVPEEISTDGGSPFKGHEYKTFLERWNIQPRLSSAYYAQSNGRAELAVKVAKKILLGNCEANGDINNEVVARALLQYRNTPLQGIDLSPAQILYGRDLKDCLPSQQEALSVRPEWRVAADEREQALRIRHVKAAESYNEHAKDLPELHERDHVAVQNQHGNYPNRWDRTGLIVQKLPNRQYHVKMDGSNRLTLRNRKFLRKIDPVCSSPAVTKFTDTSQLTHADESQKVAPAHPSSSPAPLPPPVPVVPNPVSTQSPVAEIPDIRRSSRNKQPRELFQANLKGKSHEIVTMPTE